MNLLEIGNKYDTDKQRRHKYLFLYENYIKPYKNKKIKLFEIGILNGGSIKMWEDYFSDDSKIYAIDINLNQIKYVFMDKTIYEKVDQRNKDDILNFVKKYGNFDIIIDDGDHQPMSQQMCFGFLFSFLNNGGIYVIEDLHTSYNSIRLKNDNTKISTIEILKNLRDNNEIKSDFIQKEEIDYIKNNFEFCDIVKYDEDLGKVIDVSTIDINNRLLNNTQLIPSEIAFIKKK